METLLDLSSRPPNIAVDNISFSFEPGEIIGYMVRMDQASQLF